MEKYLYKAFGLIIRSELKCTELIEASPNSSPDVEVVFSNFTHHIDLTQSWFSVQPEKIEFFIHDVGTYRISNGDKIEIAPEKTAEDDELRLFLLGSGIAAILHQRKLFPVHASAVKIKDKAVLFSADSGFGKSTLCKAFHEKGFEVIADDIVVLCSNDENNTIALPGYPQLKLWKDTLNYFQKDTTGLRKIWARDEKFGLKVNDNFANTALPLGAIFFLEKTAHENIQITPLSGLDKIFYLQQNIFRPFFLTEKEKLISFKKAGNLANEIPFFLLNRPENDFFIEEITEKILDKLNEI